MSINEEIKTLEKLGRMRLEDHMASFGYAVLVVVRMYKTSEFPEFIPRFFSLSKENAENFYSNLRLAPRGDMWNEEYKMLVRFRLDEEIEEGLENEDLLEKESNPLL